VRRMTPTRGTTPGALDVAGTAPGCALVSGRRPGAAMPQVSPSRSRRQGRDGERGAPVVLPVRPMPLLTLWRLALTDNAVEAREMELVARNEGATDYEISEAWKARHDRMDEQIVVIYGGWS
jgi:hypothetical protein